MDSTSSKDAKRHIFYVAGPAGCGKTTIALKIKDQLGMVYLEADDFHTQENRDKMKAEIPLTDEDRAGWLEILRTEASKAAREGNVVVTCSALKRKYRTFLKEDVPENLAVHFIFLKASYEVLMERVTTRQALSGHYMPPKMVRSQLADLEEPGADEADVVTVDAEKSLSEVEDEAVEKVQSLMS